MVQIRSKQSVFCYLAPLLVLKYGQEFRFSIVCLVWWTEKITPWRYPLLALGIFSQFTKYLGKQVNDNLRKEEETNKICVWPCKTNITFWTLIQLIKWDRGWLISSIESFKNLHLVIQEWKLLYNMPLDFYFP